MDEESRLKKYNNYDKCFLNIHGLGNNSNFVQNRIIMHENTNLNTIMNSIAP